jgi:DNA-binding MarR family transcriptional regulator
MRSADTPVEVSTADPSTADPSTADPSTADPSTADPSTADPAVGELTDPAGLALADAVSRLRRAMRRAARAYGPSPALPGGLSVAQLEFLSCLAENPQARPGKLARLLRLAPSSVATLVNGLARAGLVVRSGGITDRRTAVLDLTPSGRQVLAEWQEVNARILAAALAAVPASSRRSLDSSVPALRELTSAVDALADDTLADNTRPDGQQTADEVSA